MPENPKKVASPTVRMRAGQLKSIIDKLDDGPEKSWCELVCKANAPGMQIHADEAMVTRCQTASGVDLGVKIATPEPTPEPPAETSN